MQLFQRVNPAQIAKYVIQMNTKRLLVQKRSLIVLQQ